MNWLKALNWEIRFSVGKGGQKSSFCFVLISAAASSWESSDVVMVSSNVCIISVCIVCSMLFNV